MINLIAFVICTTAAVLSATQGNICLTILNSVLALTNALCMIF